MINNPPAINAPANPIATKTSDAPPFTVGLSGSDDNNVYDWSATAGTGVSTVSVTAGQGTANVTYTVTLQSGFTGTATFTASLSDTVNAAVTRQVNIQVNEPAVNNAPTITPPANPYTTVEQNAPAFPVTLSGSDDGNVYNWSATPGAGVSSVGVTSGQTAANATFSVTLQSGFSGTATFTASLSDNVNAPATQAVNITVVPPPPPADHVVISQIYGGGGNSGATYRNDYVELYNPHTVAVDIGGWTVQYGSAGGTTWQAQPLGGVMQPGQYYLISLASGGAVGAALPEANVTGEINMSGTAGKVALVSHGDPLDGCPPASEPGLVDLVGYGGTANCREGSTNAPAPSNTTAIFRKNGGSTDTNVNGADFVTGAPNPRRTTPITEIGPYVLSTDPRSNAASAPRDASISVTFTEPVEVDAGWYNISCAVTGLHNDATVAGAGRTRIITPNTNFLAGEQCTATILKDSVHDQDSDDSAPNTDTLTADKSWTFTVATGAAPSYGPEVHLTMGNPNGATADVNEPNNYLMEKPEFALSYNRDRGTPNWVSWHLADEWTGTLARVDTFRPDPAVLPDWYRVLHTDYFGSGFDRGHMVPNADRDPATSIPINQATFLMSNMIPQAPDNNQGPWANMENYLRTLLPANELYIVAGGAGTGGTGSSGFMTTFASGRVTVPAQTWKVVLVLPKDSGDDVGRVTAAARTIAVIMPNTQGIRAVNWESYIVKVDQVEELTGYDFFANVPDAVENSIEAGVNGSNPPGVADQSVSATEDTEKTFTLESARPNGNPLTYTILSGPAHGTLSTGSGATRTYTPAADFNGTDSFTFRVSDGALNSNTATVTITVSAVNDAPAPAGDARNASEDTALQFAAGELTINDAAGPADEANQTLTVTGVTGNADTHGTVVLDGGQITYTPASNYHGPASFTYQVCDDGTTSGGTDSKCATATVSVAVGSVNDAPVAAGDGYSTNSNTTLSAPAPGVLSNDTDIDSASLSAQLVSGVAHGTLALAADGSFTYTPALDFTGADGFTYRAFDGADASDVVTVSITVNDTVAPVINSSVAVALLATANSNLANVGLTASANDNGGGPVNLQVAVFGDEDDEAATLPGVVHSPDARDIAPGTLRLRAERVEANDGRVYLIIVTATDTVGNTSRSFHTVVVPKNNKQASVNSVNAQAAAALAYSTGNDGAPPAGYFVIGDGVVVGPKQ